MTRKKKPGRPLGETIGGILVGFDQQILRNLPPAHELVEKSRPVRGLSDQGGDLEVVFPDDVDAGGEPDKTAPEGT
jgi:hypothetical protein